MLTRLTILFLVFNFSLLSAQRANFKFERISVEHGLSQEIVRCILQDSQGFMWFGTNDGLNKYDGYKFTTYRHDPEDSTSLGSNNITALYEDHSGNLWIGTFEGGLNRYDRDKNDFTRYTINLYIPYKLICLLLLSIKF